MNGRWDLGVVEVGALSLVPNSDRKPGADRGKVVRGLRALLGEARRGVGKGKGKGKGGDGGLQVVGIICSGFSVTILRMWYEDAADGAAAAAPAAGAADNDNEDNEGGGDAGGAKQGRYLFSERRYTVWTMAEHMHRNMEVFGALVQAVEVVRGAAGVLCASGGGSRGGGE